MGKLNGQPHTEDKNEYTGLPEANFCRDSSTPLRVLSYPCVLLTHFVALGRMSPVPMFSRNTSNSLRKMSWRGTSLSLTASPTAASFRYTWAESTCLLFEIRNTYFYLLCDYFPVSHFQGIQDGRFR